MFVLLDESSVSCGHTDVIAFIGSQLPLVSVLFPEANFPKCPLFASLFPTARW